MGAQAGLAALTASLERQGVPYEVVEHERRLVTEQEMAVEFDQFEVGARRRHLRDLSAA